MLSKLVGLSIWPRPEWAELGCSGDQSR